jgi:hypothetical protein
MWKLQPLWVVLPPTVWQKKEKRDDGDTTGSAGTLRRKHRQQLERNQCRKKPSHGKMKPSTALRKEMAVHL